MKRKYCRYIKLEVPKVLIQSQCLCHADIDTYKIDIGIGAYNICIEPSKIY